MATHVWYNLNLHVWSVKIGKAPVRHCTRTSLRSACFRVSEHGRQQVIAKRCRQVHAYAAGTEQDCPAELPEGAIQVSYNPYKGPSFYRKDNGAPVWAADALYFVEGGLCYAINPR